MVGPVLIRIVAMAAALALVACGGSGGRGGEDGGVGTSADAAIVGDGGGLTDGAPRQDGGAFDGAVAADGAIADAASPDGGSEARIYVHLTSSHAPVEHPGESRGQTPRRWVSGYRSLHLMTDRDDADPLLVFSHGDGFVEASYADGADTVVGSAIIASLRSGTYTWARVVQTHLRFAVDATSHSMYGVIPGELEDVIILSDHTSFEGMARSRGWFRATFRAGGVALPREGSGYEFLSAPGGGFHTTVEEGETAFYFPMRLHVDNTLTDDMQLFFEVNVHEGFRWMDRSAEGYSPGVFDLTPISTERIVQAGANSYRYRITH